MDEGNLGTDGTYRRFLPRANTTSHTVTSPEQIIAVAMIGGV
jgi:hypothetical protein